MIVDPVEFPSCHLSTPGRPEVPPLQRASGFPPRTMETLRGIGGTPEGKVESESQPLRDRLERSERWRDVQTDITVGAPGGSGVPGAFCELSWRRRERVPRARPRVVRDELDSFRRARKGRMVASAEGKGIEAEACTHEVRKASATAGVEEGITKGGSGRKADDQEDNRPSIFRSCTQDMLRSLLEESPIAIQALQAQEKLVVGREANERAVPTNVGRRRTGEREGDAITDDRSKMQRTSLASGGCRAPFCVPCRSPATSEQGKRRSNRGSALSMGPADLVPGSGKSRFDLPVLGYAIPTWEKKETLALAGETVSEHTPLTMAVDYLQNLLDEVSHEIIGLVGLDLDPRKVPSRY